MLSQLELAESGHRFGAGVIGLALEQGGEGGERGGELAPLVLEGADVPGALVPRRAHRHATAIETQRGVSLSGLARARGGRGNRVEPGVGRWRRGRRLRRGDQGPRQQPGRQPHRTPTAHRAPASTRAA